MATNVINDREIAVENNDKTELSSTTIKEESNMSMGDTPFHLLGGCWTFWYTHRPTTFRNSSINYDSCLKKLGKFIDRVFLLLKKFSFLGTFGSTEEFWCYYNHMKFPFYRFFFFFFFCIKSIFINDSCFLLVIFIYLKKI